MLGATTDFSVSADGSLPLSYQWIFNNIEIIPGATAPFLQLTNLQLSQSGNYSVIVTNAFGAVTSSPSLLSVVGVPPVILIQPSNQTAAVGRTIELTVGASGSVPLTYQWSFNGTNLITGAPDAVLELTDVQLSQSGTYEVVVRNAFGTATSSKATVIITPPGTTAVIAPIESSLRAAVTNGGRVIFACDGTIQLTGALTISSNTWLDGNGHNITVSGAGVTRVLYISPRTRFQLENLTIDAGYANDGGGLLNDLGTVTITNCVFARHRATRGAAVFNTGILTISRCSFTFNSAEGATGGDGANQVIVPPPWPGSGGEADGGGIYNSGTLFVDASLFASNAATGGAGGRGSPGDYYVLGSYPTGGGSGGGGFGGALFNVGTGAFVNCTFAWNQGLGGGGGAGGAYSGPSPYADFGTGGANGAMGAGAADNSGQLNLTNCTFAFNYGSGGGGGAGGAAHVPGPGGAGGDGVGGIYNSAGLNLVNCAVALNVGIGAQGGYGARGTRLHIEYGNGPQGASAGNFSGTVTDLGP